MKIGFRSLLFIPEIFIVSFLIYYFIPLEHQYDGINSIFVSITIFLFATLVGYFISRQSNRYSSIVSKVAAFDGNMSFLYRFISVFGTKAQKEFAKIAIKHYKIVLSSRDWDAYFKQKTTTLTDINNLLIELSNKQDLTPGQSAFLSRAFFGVGEMQKIRKELITLYLEKIPKFQRVLVLFLLVILVLTISFLDSYLSLFASLIKASFVTSVIAVVVMLFRLNNLTFYEDMVGKSSALDVIEIIKGSK